MVSNWKSLDGDPAKNTHSWEGEERNGKHTKAGRDNFPHPSLWNNVPITNSRYSYDTPPQRVRIAGELSSRVIRPSTVFFSQINEIRTKYQSQKSNIQSGYQLL